MTKAEIVNEIAMKQDLKNAVQTVVEAFMTTVKIHSQRMKTYI